MSFSEVNILGVYVAPMSVLMMGAWIITMSLRHVASSFGLLRYVWHPALFMFSIYLIVLSSLTLVAAR
jgi:hypothetical protein